MIGANLFSTGLERKIELNLEKSDKFVKKHIFARSARLIMIPTSLVACALNTIVGLGNGIAAICTGGTRKSISARAFNYLSSSNLLLSSPYSNLLRMINPTAAFSPNIKTHWDGLLSHIVNPMRGLAQNCYKSNNFLKHHVISRLTYALLAVAYVVARAADGVIGIIAAPLSILTGGKLTRLNDLAWKTLQAPGIIEDLWFCIMHCINPSTLG